VYVRRQAGKEKPMILAIEAAPLLDKVNDGPLAYYSRVLPQLPGDDTVTKGVLAPEGENYEIDRKEGQTPPAWTIQQPADFKGRSAESSKMSSILGSLRFLSAEKFVAEKPSESELNKYGLKSPAYKVTVTTKDKEGKTEEHAYLFGKETDDKSA